jgi:DMSO/TMAO reductase YedYZ molybdopterin-dependent catalytic subunit
MKTKTKILAATLTAVIIIAAFAIIFILNAPNEPPQATVTVKGDLQQEKTYTVKDLTQMPQTNVTVTTNGKNATYVGVDFYKFCNQTGMNWDVGPVEVISADGTKATLNIIQAYNSTFYPYRYNDNVIMLAYAKDGQWLTNQTGGPLRLVVPYYGADYQVQNVAEISFKPWTFTITGKVANPLVLTSANLTSIQPKTVYAEFAPSVKRWSNWTGLPILDVLHAANVSDRAEMLTIIAVDGYVKNYTLAQVVEGQMMLGYAENDMPLAHSEGGPYRLFAPTDKYKWAQFWVKYVVDIKVW